VSIFSVVFEESTEFYSPKRVGENLALSVQEFIMISFLTHLDINRFNQVFFDSSFLPLRPLRLSGKLLLG
jgi:hypothetical protein